MSDFNIYDDLELLHTQQKQKEVEELQWKEKYHVAIETIEKLQVEKKELNKKIKQLEINFASLLDTARTEIKRKDNQINQLRREKDDICFRRNARPTKKHSIDESVGEDTKSGYINPFSIDRTTVPKSSISSSKPADEQNKASNSRQRNGECEEKDNRSSYRESRSEIDREGGRDRDRSRHLSRESHRRTDEGDSDHRRDRYGRTTSQGKSSDSSREKTDKGQNRHSHRSGYTKDSHQAKSTNGYISSSKYENHSKCKRDTYTERKTYKPKEESQTSNVRSDDDLREKAPPIEKLPPKENPANRKTSTLEKEILNDIKEMKKAKKSEIENEAQAKIDAIKLRTEKSNNFLDALFDDMVLNGEEEQTNDVYNDLPLETAINDKNEPKEIAPKTDENCNVEPILRTPLKKSVTTLLDDLFGPSPANSAVSTVVGRRISVSSTGESSDAVSSDTVEFVSIVTKPKERDEPKKSAPELVVSDSAIDVSSAKCTEVDKPKTNSDEVKTKTSSNSVSAAKTFQFVELDSSFYSSDEEDDDKTDNVIDLRESQSDIDSPPFEKCQLLRSDVKSKEQTSGTKEIETDLEKGVHDEIASMEETALTKPPSDVKGNHCRKSPEKPHNTETACDTSAQKENKKDSPQKDTHKHHHHSPKHGKSSYSSRSRTDKHRPTSERCRREEEERHHHHHRHHHSSKESTKSMRSSHRNKKTSTHSLKKHSRSTTTASKEKNQKESEPEVKLVWSEDTEDHTPAQVMQTAVHEDTSSDLKLYHDQVIALHCDDISDEEGVEADPPKMPTEGAKDIVPRTLEDLVTSLQCEDLSDEEEVQFVVETNNGLAMSEATQVSNENFVVGPFDVLCYEEGELMESPVKFVSINQPFVSNDEMIITNIEETQPYAVCAVDENEMAPIFVEESTADMNQPCQSMFASESTTPTADEFFENRKQADEPSDPTNPQTESEKSPSKPTNSPPSQELSSSQHSTDVSQSIGRRKKLKTPRKNIDTGLRHPSATDLKALLPSRCTKSDDECGLTVTKQSDASNLCPRRRQSASDLGEAATGSCKEPILQEVTNSEEANVTDLTQAIQKPCLVVLEEQQKDMSPLWVEEESIEATIVPQPVTAITSGEQSVTVEARACQDVPSTELIAENVSKKRNRDDDDDALVTTSQIEDHKQKSTIQPPSAISVEEPESLFSESSTAVCANKCETKAITTDTEVRQMELNSQNSSVCEIHKTEHVTEAGPSLNDFSDTNLEKGPPNGIIECDGMNNEFGHKSIGLDVNDNRKGFQEPLVSDNQEKRVDDLTPPIDEKQVAANFNRREQSKNDDSSCDEEPFVSKTTITSDDKKKPNNTGEELPLKQVAKRVRRNEFLKEVLPDCLVTPKSTVADDQKIIKVAIGEQRAPTSGDNSKLNSNTLQTSSRCVVKLPILPVFSCFDAKISKLQLTDDQQVGTSETQANLLGCKISPNSKLLQDAPCSDEKQSIPAPVFNVKNSKSPQKVATSDANSKPNNNNGKPSAPTDLPNFVCEKSEASSTEEQHVLTSDQNTKTSSSVMQSPTICDEKTFILTDSSNSATKQSETLKTDEQPVTTSEAVLRNGVGSEENKVQLKCDSMKTKTSLPHVDVNNAACALENTYDVVTTSGDKTTNDAICTKNVSDLDSVNENNKTNSPSDKSNISLESRHNKKYKKRILNSFNNCKTSAAESDKLPLQHSTSGEIEKLVTCNDKRKEKTTILYDDDTTEEVQCLDVQSPTTSGNKPKQRKKNVHQISGTDARNYAANQQLAESDTKNVHMGQTKQFSTVTCENAPTNGKEQKHGGRHIDAGKKRPASVALSDDNKVKKTTLEHSTNYDATEVLSVTADTQQIDQKASGVKRKYKKRSLQDCTDIKVHRPTVVAATDGPSVNKKHPRAIASSDDNNVEKTHVVPVVTADIQKIDQKTSAVKRKYKKRNSQDNTVQDSQVHCSTVVATCGDVPVDLKDTASIQNHVPMKSSQDENQQLIPNDTPDITSCMSVPSSNESQIHDGKDNNAIYIKRKMKPSKHPKKRRKCSTSSSDTINVTSDSQSTMPSLNIIDVQPSPTPAGKRTPAVTPTHHKIFHEDVYPEHQPPPVYNANGDDIQYQEIDNRMRSIFQSPTYPHVNGGPSLDGANETNTCVKLQVDISKEDITIDETLNPDESSQCDTSSSSRKISVGSNDYVIETVGAHTANVFITRKKCKKRTKAVKLAVATA